MSNRVIHQEPTLQQTINLADPQVFKAIWQQNQPSLFYLAYAIVGSQPEAEDIATESFVKLWDQRANFTSPLAIRSWLRTTTRNACLNLLKQQKVKASRIAEMTALFEDVADEWNREDILSGVLTAVYKEIDALPPKSREVFKLRYIKGLGNEEIAAQLGIHHQSVRDHLVRALKTLRLSLNKDSRLLGVILLLLYWRE